MTNPDDLRDRGERLLALADLVAAAQEHAQDGTIDVRTEDEWATLNVVLGDPHATGGSGGTQTDDDPDTPTAEATEDTDDADQLWCGICGQGPFRDGSALSGHHIGTGHDGDTEPVTKPPDDQGYAPSDVVCDQCGADFDRPSALQNHHNSTICGATLPDRLSVADLKDIVADTDTLYEVDQELRELSRKQTRQLLQQHDLFHQVEQGGDLVNEMDGEVDTPEGDDTYQEYYDRTEEKA